MKVLLFFLLVLFFQTSIAQSSSVKTKQLTISSELYSKLQGDWYLSETEFVDGHGSTADSSRFFSNQNESRKIIFNDHLLKVISDSTIRFYSGGTRKFRFDIEYDSLYEANFLKVFTISKKNSKELESYEIIKCGYDELILKSYNYLNNALDAVSFSIFYVYRRKDVDSLLSKINGNWYHCSSDYKSIGSNSTDTSEITFTRINNDSLCGEYYNKMLLNFHRKNDSNICSIATSVRNTFNVYSMDFMIDPKNKMLYFGNEEYIIYNILALNRDEFKISLNIEKTEFYKSNNTHNSR